MKKAVYVTDRTRYKQVNGLLVDGNLRMKRTPVSVRLTVDSLGQSLSLAIDGVIMLHIAMEDVADMITEVKDDKK